MSLHIELMPKFSPSIYNCYCLSATFTWVLLSKFFSKIAALPSRSHPTATRSMSGDNNWNDHADGWDTNDMVVVYASKTFESGRCNIDGTKVLDFGCTTGLLSQRMVTRVASIKAVDPA